MRFSFRLQRTPSIDKLKKKYINQIEHEKKIINKQLEQLVSLLKNNLIDQLTYKRLEAILKIHSSRARFIKKQQEALRKLEKKDYII